MLEQFVLVIVVDIFFDYDVFVVVLLVISTSTGKSVIREKAVRGGAAYLIPFPRQSKVIQSCRREVLAIHLYKSRSR